jgi:hypothetical protein
MTERISISQINRLGVRLRDAEVPSDEDLDLLAQYQRSLDPLFQETLEVVRAAYRRALPDLSFEATARPKQVRSVVAKLRRHGTRLSKMQDLLGFRIVVPRMHHQEALLAELPLGERWAVVDRRKAPSAGYRAVHIVHKGDVGYIECQIRTTLQQLWADISERVDRIVPGVKYGEGEPAGLELLGQLSGVITQFEDLELSTYSGTAEVPEDLDELANLVHQNVVHYLEEILEKMPGG